MGTICGLFGEYFGTILVIFGYYLGTIWGLFAVNFNATRRDIVLGAHADRKNHLHALKTCFPLLAQRDARICTDSILTTVHMSTSTGRTRVMEPSRRHEVCTIAQNVQINDSGDMSTIDAPHGLAHTC